MLTTEKQSTLGSVQKQDDFIHRHIGPSPAEIAEMLRIIGVESVDELIASTVPGSIRLAKELSLGCPTSEADALKKLRSYADKNRVLKSMIGMGYYGTFVPKVILRNVLENPGWYTAYTPYQAEISQGRLESLLTFQQMVMELTGMEMANASLLDEATAAAEAMALCKRAGKSKSNSFFVADDVHPQTLDVVRTRAKYFDFDIVVGEVEQLEEQDCFGALLQYPGTTGEARDLTSFIEAAHAKDCLVAVATDLLSLTLLKPPGEMLSLIHI
jgi:glycine dehydrogenase